ncbi:MAG: 3',5'-cyclic-AMP phosphodiesterase [Gammaproteobacteria bacterium]
MEPILPIRIAQISDFHLFGKPEEVFYGLNTEKSFLAVLDLVKSAQPFDFCLLTGDLAQDHFDQTYQRLIHHITHTLPYPCYWLPGNHDDPELMANIFAKTQIESNKSILIQDWHLILLNSHKPKSDAGYLAKTECDFLKTQLKNYPTHHTLVVLHHHPIKLDSTWLDSVMLENAAEFLEIIDNHHQIRGIVFGHVHQESEIYRNHIPYLSSPSTCVQFLPKSTPFKLDLNAHPGYRCIELYPDGKIKTNIERIKHLTGQVDPNAAGY